METTTTKPYKISEKINDHIKVLHKITTITRSHCVSHCAKTKPPPMEHLLTFSRKYHKQLYFQLKFNSENFFSRYIIYVTQMNCSVCGVDPFFLPKAKKKSSKYVGTSPAKSYKYLATIYTQRNNGCRARSMLSEYSILNSCSYTKNVCASVPVLVGVCEN